jgi:CBS-domain-containing membrane protein
VTTLEDAARLVTEHQVRRRPVLNCERQLVASQALEDVS